MTGQAPIDRNAMPTMKLIKPIRLMSTMNPVGLNERFGVSRARNVTVSVSPGDAAGRSESLGSPVIK